MYLHFWSSDYAGVSHQTYHNCWKETFRESWEDSHSSVKSKLSVLCNYKFFSALTFSTEDSSHLLDSWCAEPQTLSNIITKHAGRAKTVDKEEPPETCSGKFSNKVSLDQVLHYVRPKYLLWYPCMFKHHLLNQVMGIHCLYIDIYTSSIQMQNLLSYFNTRMLLQYKVHKESHVLIFIR